MCIQRWTLVFCVSVGLGSGMSWAKAPPAENEYVPARLDCQGSDDKTLAETYRADQADRTENHPDRKARDLARRELVLDRIDTLCTPGDHFHAAMVLQHSSEPNHHLLAHRLARYGAEKGHDKSKWLTGAAWDRYFVSRGLPQFFGTQFKWNESKQLCLIQVDPESTAEKRADFERDPIEAIYALILERNGLSHLPKTLNSLEQNGLVCPPHVWAEWTGE